MAANNVTNVRVTNSIDKLILSNFDMVFLDGGKEHYLEHLKKLEEACCLPNTLVVVDDCYFNGDVLNDAPTTDKGRGVRDMLDYVATSDKWDRTLLPMCNGVLLLRKR